jgi:hypothetical protein
MTSDASFGSTEVMEKGLEECKEAVDVRVMILAMELAKYKLDLAGVQEFR